jgi:hypothetical protein
MTVRNGATKGSVGQMDMTDSLSDVLLASLYALAEAGETEATCRFAGRACAILRRSNPTAARRFNVLLHRLASRLTWQEPPVHNGMRK